MKTISEEIHDFVVENYLFGMEDTPLSEDTSFLDTGIIDSTGVLELISFLERRFDIEVADEEIIPANLDSVGRLSSFVGRKVATSVTEVSL